MWTAIAAGIVAAAYVGKLPPAIPLLREEFRLSLVAAGWVNSTFNTLAITTAVFFGALAAALGTLFGQLAVRTERALTRPAAAVA